MNSIYLLTSTEGKCRRLNKVILLSFNTSSFQNHNLFDRTCHLTQSYRRENSLITDRARSQGKATSISFRSSFVKDAARSLAGRSRARQ